MSIHIVTVLLQPFKIDPFTTKYFTKISFFSNSNLLFSSHTLAWACGLWFNLFSMLAFSYLSHALLHFSETGTTFYLKHTLQVQQFSDLSFYLITTRSPLSIAQVSSSFKWLDTRASTSTTPALITEALRCATSLQLF